MKLVLALRAAAAVASLLFVALLVTSGWALMAGYVPSDAEAFASVLYLRRMGGLAAAARSLHYHLASGLVISGFVYLLTTYLAGRHSVKKAWWLGLTSYLLALALCFTGFPLPMDQNAYWGTVVRLGIVETAPLGGPPAADLLRGGAVWNASTLPRFYALHVSILPLLAVLLLVPLVRPLREAGRGRLAWLWGVGAALVGCYAWGFLVPAPLELAADATASDYVPRPEWYFLWLFQFGKYVEAAPWVRSLLLPLFGLGLLYGLPALRQKETGGRTALAAGWCLTWIALTALALYDDRDLPPRLQNEEAVLVEAADHYREHCSECHGDDGRGQGSRTRAFGLKTSDLTLPELWLTSSHADMERVIRDGKGEDMPSFARALTGVQVEALVDYLDQTYRP